MPGMYAPPAVELPNTSAMVGMPAAESWVRSRNIRPPGMKTSFCVGRSAPPDSTREITGSRFCIAMSLRAEALRSVHGLLVPPRTVGIVGDDQAFDALDDADTARRRWRRRGSRCPTRRAGTVRGTASPRRCSSSMRSRAQAACRACGAASMYFSPPPGDGLGVLGLDLGELRSCHRPRRSASVRLWRRRRSIQLRTRSDAHDWYPNRLAARPVRISVVPPPMPRMRMSRYCRSTSDFAHVAEAAEQLHGLVGDPFAGLDGGVLREADLGDQVGLAVDGPLDDVRGCRPGRHRSGAPSR